MFRQILVGALLAGAASGLAAGLLNLIFLQDILLQAEVYETGLVHMSATGAGDAPLVSARNALTLLFTMLLYCGYGLLLTAMMAMRSLRGDRIDGRSGLVWGIAGFAVLVLGPAFSLPSELPGATESALNLRQFWWAVFVVTSGVAVWLLAFVKSPWSWPGAAILLIGPHVFGPLRPDSYTGTAPMELAALFATRSIGTGLMAWLVLGTVAGAIWWRESSQKA